MGFLFKTKHEPKPASSPSHGPIAAPPPAPAPGQAMPYAWGPQHGSPKPQPRPVDAIRPAGYLPAPQSSPPTHDLHNHRPPPPIIVNQNYFLSPPISHRPMANPYPSSNGSCALTRLKLSSAVDLAGQMIPGDVVHQIIEDDIPRWHSQATQLINQGAAINDQIRSEFDRLMTLIDGDKLVGNEKQLFTYYADGQAPASDPSQSSLLPVSKSMPKKSKKDAPKGQTTNMASTLVSGNYFAKVELYANSKLPLDLPPLRLYISTYPLICLAARYSEKVYETPRGAERDVHLDADWKTGAKAMCIKSVPMDHVNTIVFAIRGTSTFMDWAVNLNTAPIAPSGFLVSQRFLCLQLVDC
jgi:hypothetical protein